MPLERLLTRAEAEASEAIGQEMYDLLDLSGALIKPQTEYSEKKGVGLVPVWVSNETRPILVELFRQAERLHWDDPFLDVLLEEYERNTQYGLITDLVNQTVLHGFRMCLPLGRTPADKNPELTGMPVIDDLIEGAHLVNGYREKVTIGRLARYYGAIVPEGRTEGIVFPQQTTTIESHFRISDAKGARHFMTPSEFGYLAVAARTILPNDSMAEGSMLVTYANQKTQDKLAENGLVCEPVMGDPRIPPVDRNAEREIVGRLDDYEPVALVYNRQNSGVLEAGFPFVRPVDLT